MQLLRTIALLLLAAVLGGCGTVHNSGNSLSLSASATGIKSITFNWLAVSGATHYKLFVNPDGVSGFTQVGSDLTTTSTVVSIPVHLTDWVNARYLVEAYDSSGGVIATSSSISITPLMLDSIGYIKSSNTETLDHFGFSVAVSGDGNTMAVSAPGEDSNATGINGDQTNNSAIDSGAVYLFVRSGQTWVQQAYIKASNTDSGDAFGTSVALSSDGNSLAVGAVGEDSSATGINGVQSDNSASNAGAVYLFSRLGTVWSQQSYIKASNTDSGDAFGDSVALSGDGNTLAVGAKGEGSNATGINGIETDNSLSNAGAVYLFTRSSTGWSQQAYIKASNTDSGDAFGTSVTLDSYGNTLGVGAPGESSAATGINSNGQSDNSAPAAGAVYLFTRSAGNWSQQAYAKASNTDSGDAFGTSVALSGDGTALAVGAVGEDSASTGIDGDQLNNNAFNSGATYLFSWNGTDWSQQAYIKATNTDPSDNFGVSVALSSDGNVLAVGANLEDSNAQGMGGNPLDNSATDAGAVYLYARTAGSWSPRSYAKAPNTDALDNFGGSVSLSSDGNTLVAGAVGEDSSATGINGDMTNNTNASSGAAYLY